VKTCGGFNWSKSEECFHCLCIIVWSHGLDIYDGEGPSWSYGSWISNYLCNQWLSQIKLWVRTPFMERCTRYNIMW